MTTNAKEPNGLEEQTAKPTDPPASFSSSLDYKQELLQQAHTRDPLAPLRDPKERARLLDQERKRHAEQVSRPRRGRRLSLVRRPHFCPECREIVLQVHDGGRWICTQCAGTKACLPEPSEAVPSRRLRQDLPLASTRPRYCGVMTMVGVDSGSGKAVYKRMWCNTYGCPQCGPRRYRRARKAIAAAAEQWRLTKFWTLTLDPKKIPPEAGLRARIKYLRECWRKLRVYLQRKHGRTIAFIAVVELHQSGVPHLHVLIGEWIEHAWMKRAWSAVGGGEIVWVEPVTIRRVSAYLAKYVTKEKLNDVPASVRRFSASGGISLFAKVSRDESRYWFCSRLPIDLLRDYAQAVEDERHWVVTNGEQVLVLFIAEILVLAQHFRLSARKK